MGKTHKPRSGSLQVWPRKRAKRAYARIRAWATHKDTKPLGFAGYKVGMGHITYTQTRSSSPNKGRTETKPVTIIECPPLKVMAVTYYKNTTYGVKKVAEVRADSQDKHFIRKLLPTKNRKAKIPSEFDDVRLVVHTQPSLTGIGKKKPEVFEVALGGKKDDKTAKASELLGKELSVNDVFAISDQVDTHSITKGHGTQGPVKRHGVALRQHKSEKGTRGPANLGGWTGNRSWTVAHAGQTGYHQRTEYNKWIVDVQSEALQNHFKHYGVVKNPYIILHGSVGGATKRLIRFNVATRPNPKLKEAPKVEELIL